MGTAARAAPAIAQSVCAAGFHLGKHGSCVFSRNADSMVLIVLICLCRREAEMRNSILAQVLDQSARARRKHL